jgi:hypothetical protein
MGAKKEIGLRNASPTAKAALVISILALVMATTAGTFAAIKLGKNSVKTKNVKNNAITEQKIADSAVSEKKIKDGAVTAGKLGSLAVPTAFVRFNSAGTYVPSQSRGVNNINKPVPNVACLDLTFTPTTAVVGRGVGAGGPPIQSAQVAVGADAVALGCPSGFQDAAVQVAGIASVQDVYAWFE